MPWIGSTVFALRYVTKDVKQRWKSFLVGLLTIVIVVFVVSILYNSVLKASIIFVKLSEDQVGETDVMFTPKLTEKNTIPFINETLLEEKLFFRQRRRNLNEGVLVDNDSSSSMSDDVGLVGISPRWIFYGKVENRDTPTLNTTAILLIVDTKKEKEIGIGRTWNHRPLGEAECHVKDNILSAIGVESNMGRRVNIRLELQTLLQAMSGANQAIAQDLNNSNDEDDEDGGGGSASSELGNVGGGGSGSESSNDPSSKPSNTDPKQSGTETLSETSSNLRNSTDFLRVILESAGVDFEQRVVVNLTQVAEELRASGTEIPPQFNLLFEMLGPINMTLGQVFNVFGGNNSALLGDIYGEYSVVDSIGSPKGKFPPALGNVIILDSKYLLRTFTDTMLRNFLLQLLLRIGGNEQSVRDFFYNFKLNEYALSVAGMYRDRFSTYTKNQGERDSDMLGLSKRIIDRLGIGYPVDMTYPIIEVLGGLQFLRLFLDQIFVAVVVMLGILGIILIFTLLLANVEEKTYEYGMLRAMGLKKHSLIQVILSHAFYFAIPGIICGMIASFLTNIAVEFIIRDKVAKANYKIEYVLNWVSIVVPILLGLFIPLAANIVPIRTALSKTLRDSLDITHQTFNETKVKMIRLENLGVAPWQTAVAIALVVIGFIVYYMIPYAFIFQKLPLFFYILNGVLLAMLLGLCAVTVVIQPILERIILFFLLVGPDRKMHTLISKNLAGHRKRSRKTFLMFTLAIAFIIFAGVSFSLQTTNIVANVKALLGSDATIQSLTSAYPLPEQELSAYLDSEVANGTVAGYSYQSFEMKSQPFISSTAFSSLAFYSDQSVRIYGVSQNYLSVAYSDYFMYTSYDTDLPYKYLAKRKPDVIDSLYTEAKKAKVRGERDEFYPEVTFSNQKSGGNISSFDPAEKYRNYADVIASEALRPISGISLKSPMQIRFYSVHPKTKVSSLENILAKSRALVKKMPGFFFSSYQLTAANSPVLISFDEYQYLANLCATSVNYEEYDGSVPKEKILIRFRTKNEKKIVSILNNVKSLTRAEFVTVSNIRELIKSTKQATDALLAFFNVIAVIAIVLCFFVLAVSFTGNVRDNSWEFGVLRSVGLSVNKLIRAYIYEALCLVISAFFCGTVIGIVIAATLTAQFNLFLEMPFQFNFPYPIFFSMMGMSLIVAVVGSYLPARALKRQQIASVLKGST